jgi:DNA-binding response OmpR family regulator
VLVADDEPRIRLALRSCLESEGYEVDEAADGMEALDVIIRRAPDVMVLDLAMPNLDGMRALQELEAVHGQFKPRVIVLTAWGSVPAAFRAIALGAGAFLEKPLIPSALLRVVREVLEEGGGAGAAHGTGAEAPGVPVDWDEPLRE